MNTEFWILISEYSFPQTAEGCPAMLKALVNFNINVCFHLVVNEMTKGGLASVVERRLNTLNIACLSCRLAQLQLKAC